MCATCTHCIGLCVCVLVFRAGTTAQRRKTWHSTVAMSSSPCVNKLSLQCYRPTRTYITSFRGKGGGSSLSLSLALFFTYTAEKNKSVAWIKQRKIPPPTQLLLKPFLASQEKKTPKIKSSSGCFQDAEILGRPLTEPSMIAASRQDILEKPQTVEGIWRQQRFLFYFFCVWGGVVGLGGGGLKTSCIPKNNVNLFSTVRRVPFCQSASCPSATTSSIYVEYGSGLKCCGPFSLCLR